MGNISRERSSMWVIAEMYRNGSDLGKSVELDEIDELIDLLSQRLSIHPNFLSYDPDNLIEFEEMACKYYSEVLYKEILDYAEITRFVRELVAYVGKAILLNTNAQWNPLGSLHSTDIDLFGKITGMKDGRKKAVQSISLSWKHSNHHAGQEHYWIPKKKLSLQPVFIHQKQTCQRHLAIFNF